MNIYVHKQINLYDIGEALTVGEGHPEVEAEVRVLPLLAIPEDTINAVLKRWSF